MLTFIKVFLLRRRFIRAMRGRDDAAVADAYNRLIDTIGFDEADRVIEKWERSV